MIDLKFGLFWSGGKLSYLRYLTLASLRYHHPNSVIELYLQGEWKKDGFMWGCEEQDFQSDSLEEYVTPDEIYNLGISTKEFNEFSNYPPNFQSDFFRWWWLKNNSGFYLDIDQIVLKPFNILPLDNNLIYSAYKADSCGLYTPVGVIGACDSELVNWTNQLLPQFYNVNDYNSLGPFMMRCVLGIKKWKDKAWNSSWEHFYPVKDSYLVPSIYDGSFYPNDNAVCLHWFGGHPASQKFNKKYTKEFAKSSSDTISSLLRDKGII